MFTGLPGVSRSQGMHARSWYWGPEALGCRTLRLESQSSTVLRMQPYPGLLIPFGRVSCMARPASVPDYGHWVSYCCVALVFGSGLWLGVGFGNPATPALGLGRVCLGTVCGVVPLLPAGVCGVCGWALVSACTPTCVIRDMGRAWLRARSACTPPFLVLVCGVGARAGVWVLAAPRNSLGRCRGVCVHVCPPRVVSCTSWLAVLCGGVWLVPRPATPCWCAGVCVCLCARPACFPPFLAGVCCVGVPAGLGSRLCPALLGWVVGVFFFGGGACHVLALWCRSLAVPVPGLVVSVPPSPLFPAGLLALFFFRPSVVCVRAFWVSLYPAGRCSWLGVAGFGWVVPLCPIGGSCLRCLLGGVFGRLLRCWWAVWWLWAVLLPPPPRLVFFFGGSACSSLCLPCAGARTGLHSVWSSGLLLVVAFCLAVSRPHGSGGLCTCWARRPFLPG